MGGVERQYTTASTASRSGVAKSRVYTGAYERAARNPKFDAITDLDELTRLHDQAVARMAANETFKHGFGKTRLELLQETHPQLYNKMVGLRTRLASLRSSAGNLNERMGKAIDDFLTSPEDASLADLADALDVAITRGPKAGVSLKQINAEIRAVRQEIRVLRPAWEAADTTPYTQNRSAFRYHAPDEAAAIDEVVRTSLGIGDGLLDAIEEVRLARFGGDVSPFSIQGSLGLAAHALTDPITTARSIPRALKELD